MKIAISGTQCIGKTTFIDDFLKRWSMYRKPSSSYRNIVKKKKFSINQEGTEDGQRAILNALIDDTQRTKYDYTIFDRCVLDNLVYTMWLSSKGKVTDKFVKETITLVRESLSYFDIIFFLPITKHSPVKIIEESHRDIDKIYRDEIDVLFKALMDAYHKQSHVYFPFGNDLGSPALIEIFGSRIERIQLVQFYINDAGDILGDDESLLNEELTEEKLLLAREAYGLNQ